MIINGYNLIILVGAVHGLIMSFLLFFSKKGSRSGNILLALVLVFYTLPLLRIVLIDIAFFRSYGMWFLSIELLYGLGPSLFLYSKTVTDPDYILSKVDFLHFVPVGIEFVYYLSPFYRQPSNYVFTSVQDIHHLIWMIQQSGAIISIVIYLFLTNKLLLRYSKWVKGNFSDTNNRALSWLRRPVILYSIFFALWLCLRAVDVFQFDDSMPIAPYYPLLIFLSISTYWIGTRGYFQSQVDVVGFSQSRHEKTNDSADNLLLDPIYSELEAIMARDKPYLDNDLSLTQLAEHLRINSRLLSRAINSKAKMNFYDFVNEYRIEEFKRQAILPNTRKTLVDLAHECGFGSKATFNHVFKRSTGLTPSQYKKQYQLPTNGRSQSE